MAQFQFPSASDMIQSLSDEQKAEIIAATIMQRVLSVYAEEEFPVGHMHSLNPEVVVCGLYLYSTTVGSIRTLAVLEHTEDTHFKAIASFYQFPDGHIGFGINDEPEAAPSPEAKLVLDELNGIFNLALQQAEERNAA